MFGPLQTTAADIPQAVQLFSNGINVVTGIVGFLITYYAYRGWRRNDSRAMFYIAVGFALTVGIPFALFVPVALLQLGESVLVAFSVVRNVVTLLGLLSILYALRLPSE
jgi:hypothetical protein